MNYQGFEGLLLYKLLLSKRIPAIYFWNYVIDINLFIVQRNDATWMLI